MEIDKSRAIKAGVAGVVLELVFSFFGLILVLIDSKCEGFYCTFGSLGTFGLTLLIITLWGMFLFGYVFSSFKFVFLTLGGFITLFSFFVLGMVIFVTYERYRYYRSKEKVVVEKWKNQKNVKT